MTSRSLLLLFALLAGGSLLSCTFDPSAANERFACSEDQDCLGEYSCYVETGQCILGLCPPDHVRPCTCPPEHWPGLRLCRSDGEGWLPCVCTGPSEGEGEGFEGEGEGFEGEGEGFEGEGEGFEGEGEGAEGEGEGEEGEGEGAEGEGEGEEERFPWVRLAAGDYSMGSRFGSLDELPVHEVLLPPFAISRSEITVGMYRACVEAGGCSAEGLGGAYYEPLTCTWGLPDSDDKPLNCVTWEQARSYARWLGGGARLCSESEWEYAARSEGDGRPYPWGEDSSDDRHAVSVWSSCEGPCPAYSRPEGNSEQGVCDLAGNVWEWVEDCYHLGYDHPEPAPTDGSPWIGESCALGRVLRGGSYVNFGTELRSSNRNLMLPEFRSGAVGFRVCRSR